jgi:hypothetical protein
VAIACKKRAVFSAESLIRKPRFAQGPSVYQCFSRVLLDTDGIRQVAESGMVCPSGRRGNCDSISSPAGEINIDAWRLFSYKKHHVIKDKSVLSASLQ